MDANPSEMAAPSTASGIRVSRDVGRRSYSADVRNDRLDHAIRDHEDEEDMLKVASLDDNTRGVLDDQPHERFTHLHPNQDSTGKDRSSTSRKPLEDDRSDDPTDFGADRQSSSAEQGGQSTAEKAGVILVSLVFLRFLGSLS